jgi:hypothetical protein
MKKLFPAVIALTLLGIVEAEAIPITFTTDLLGSAEDPPNDSPGTGTATVVFDLDALTMLVEADFQDLVAGTTAAHIHCCTTDPFEGNVGVATQTPSFSLFPLGVTAGTFSQLFDLTLDSSWNPAFITANGGTTAGATAALAAGLGSGRAYFNIHTSTFPGGEIRGFLTPVAEPSTLALLGLAGLGTLFLATRRRRVSR